MNTRIHEFNLLEDDTIELEVEFDYAFYPGKYNGRPEDCYPDEEECEVNLEAGWEQKVTAVNLKLANENIKYINHQLERLPIAEWAGELEQARQEAYGDFLYEQEKDRRLGL